MSQEKIERWNEVDGNLDNGEKLQAFLDSTTDAYAILQLRRTDETVYERFESYEALKRQGKEPNIDHYDVVYRERCSHRCRRADSVLLSAGPAASVPIFLCLGVAANERSHPLL